MTSSRCRQAASVGQRELVTGGADFQPGVTGMVEPVVSENLIRPGRVERYECPQAQEPRRTRRLLPGPGRPRPRSPHPPVRLGVIAAPHAVITHVIGCRGGENGRRRWTGDPDEARELAVPRRRRVRGPGAVGDPTHDYEISANGCGVGPQVAGSRSHGTMLRVIAPSATSRRRRVAAIGRSRASNARSSPGTSRTDNPQTPQRSRDSATLLPSDESVRGGRPEPHDDETSSDPLVPEVQRFHQQPRREPTRA